MQRRIYMAIEYERVNWDTTKFVNPTNMNTMDKGIKDACDGVNENSTAISEVNSNLGQKSEASGVTGNTAFAKINSLDSNLKDLCQVYYGYGYTDDNGFVAINKPNGYIPVGIYSSINGIIALLGYDVPNQNQFYAKFLQWNLNVAKQTNVSYYVLFMPYRSHNLN